MVWTSSAWASTLNDAVSLYAKGDVATSSAVAVALNTSDGYALAAKALSLGASLFPESQREASYEKAEQYARKAIELDPKNAEAHMELARALGRLAQFRGVLQSLGLASEVRSELELAIRLDPKMAAPYVALALWHAEVPMVAGGRNSEVEPNIQKALALEPGVIIHRLEYANALMKVSQRNRKKAIGQLEIAVKLTPRDYWDKIDLENAKKMLASMR
ncbi:MAG: hypothetical protein U0Z75_00140 [Deinococcaceae bacterium]